MSLKHFEDFSPGQVLEYGAYRVTRDEVISFAQEFDPQPQHLSEAAAAKTMLGVLCASGWHTTAMVMRLQYDHFMNEAAALGAPGVEEVKWIKPVLPGDVLSVRGAVGKMRPSMSRPEMGLMEMEFAVLNQRGKTVMTQRNFLMMGRRGVAASPQVAERAAPVTPAPFAELGQPQNPSAILGYLEDIEIGATLDLGTYEFTRENVTRFASAYDPQPFHLSDDAAARSHFGRLAASGWQTAAAYMKCMIARRDAIMADMQARGEPLPPRGPSPGFRDLRWLRPVYPGDVVRYSSTPVEKRPTSRSGWGLVFTQGVGVNQHGQRVYEYRGSSFRPLRG